MEKTKQDTTLGIGCLSSRIHPITKYNRTFHNLKIIDMNKSFVGTGFLIALVILSLHICNRQISLALENEIQPNVNEVVLRIEGMTCKVCSLTIKKTLNKISGVVDAEVSYQKKEAEVLYEGSNVTTDQIIESIENTGNYQVEVIKRTSLGETPATRINHKMP